MSVSAAARSMGRALIASSPASPAARSAARALSFHGSSLSGASPRAGAAVGAPLPQWQAPLGAVGAGRSGSGGLAAGRSGLLFGGVRAPVNAPGRGGAAAGARGMADAEPATVRALRSGSVSVVSWALRRVGTRWRDARNAGRRSSSGF